MPNSTTESAPGSHHQPQIEVIAILSLLIWMALRLVASETLTTLLDRTDPGAGLNARVIGLLIAQLVLELLFAAVWVGLIVRSFALWLRPDRVPLTSMSTLQIINQTAIELVRSIAAILYRVPFLLIPAVAEIFRLLFVPFLVVFEPDYQKGRVDALARSRAVFAQRYLLSVLVFLVFVPGWAVLEHQAFPDTAPLLEAPMQAILSLAFSTAGTALLSLCVLQILWSDQEPFLLHHGDSE